MCKLHIDVHMCSQGYFATAGSGMYYACPQGTHAPSPGQSSCSQCAVETYSSAPAASSCFFCAQAKLDGAASCSSGNHRALLVHVDERLTCFFNSTIIDINTHCKAGTHFSGSSCVSTPAGDHNSSSQRANTTG